MPEYEVIPGGGNVIHHRPVQIFVLLSDSFPSLIEETEEQEEQEELQLRLQRCCNPASR